MLFGLMVTPDIANNQNQLSRANNMNRLEDADDWDRRNVAGAGRGTLNQQYNGSVPPNTIAANMDLQVPNYNLTTGQNGMSVGSMAAWGTVSKVEEWEPGFLISVVRRGELNLPCSG